MNNLITEIDILNESKDCFLQYAEEVLTDRAVPSAEDGLLSVHRKLIWTMEEVLKMTNKSKFKKSASIVGTTLATSYFHGDTACYGALCKIAQPYLMRYPLIEGDGNLGTQEGNGMEAAARYTNARPSQYADLMMTDFKKNVVPLKETYNGEYMEPVVLPSAIPNAIVNGREAIAIGMSHNSLPHNMTEVCEAIIARLNKGTSLTIDEVMQYIKGPDFPLNNIVINSKDIKTAFATGHSSTSLKVRGEYIIDKDKIIFNTIPYRTYRNKIKEQINKNIEILEEYIEDFSDESNVGINKLVFKVKKGINPEKAVLKLFALTDLQTTLSYNMNYIVNGTPKMCSMMDLIDAYVNHQINVLIASTKYDLNKAEKRKHILEGLLLIISNIDKAINLIRNSLNKNEAQIKLINEFNIDQEQASAVLDMKLSRLTKLDKDDLIKELEEKKIIIAECQKILTEEIYRNQKIIKKIELIKTKYGDKRRTQLLNIEVPKEEKEIAEVVPIDVVVVTTESGLIKKVPVTSFKVQKRNGKGVKTADDVILSAIKTNTVDNLVLFSDKGIMYKILVDNIPDGTNATKGVPISSLIKINTDEHIIAISSLHRKTIPKFIIFITQNGIIKKSYLEEYFKTKRNTGIKALNLQEGDSLVKISFQDEEDLLLLSENGMSIRIKTSDIGAIGRVATGVKGMKLNEGDKVISAMPIHKESDYVAIFTKEGLCKKVELKEYSIQMRNGKGTITSLNKIAGAVMVDNDDNIAIFGRPNNLCIPVKEISLLSKKATGVKSIKTGIINSITKI